MPTLRFMLNVEMTRMQVIRTVRSFFSDEARANPRKRAVRHKVYRRALATHEEARRQVFH